MIKEYLRLLFDGSILYVFRDMFHHLHRLQEFKKTDFTNVYSYYRKYKKTGSIEKRVLVESILEFPHANNTNAILNILLGNKYVTYSMGVVRDRFHIEVKYLLKQYNIQKTVYMYTMLNFYYKIKAFIIFIKNIKNLSYSQKNGWYILVDGIDIGDLIYDEFLRFTNLPTYRKLDIPYMLFIIRGIFYFYRYKSILEKNRITDIITSHPVYATYGTLIRAAASLNRGIKVYTWYSQKPLNISCDVASRNFIRKPKTFDRDLLDQVLSKYGKEKLLEEFDVSLQSRMQGNSKNDIDVQFVYKNTDIDNDNEFIKKYKKHPDGKNVFIFSHAFVDAVRYTEPLYSDYYTWLYETLVSLSEISNKHNIYVKPHPSEPLYKCDVTVPNVVKEVNIKYHANYIFLDKKVHNRVIFSLADSIITAVGTIAEEAVPHGIPVLAAGYALYKDAHIVIQPDTIEEYKKHLESIEYLPKPTPEMIENAKFAFLLDTKYYLVDASFLKTSNFVTGYDLDRKTMYEAINALYNEAILLGDEPLFKMFSYMLDNNNHDIVDLTL